MHSADLRAFVAFADALNFTHAARAVHLTQPALFACVKRLGTQVGAPLYERRGRALALTRAGEKLAAHGRDVLEAERATLAAIRGDEVTSTCVLAIGEGALTHVVGESVAAFARAHPQTLRVTIADGPAALALVSKGLAHVAVVANARHDEDDDDKNDKNDKSDNDLVARGLVRSRIVAVARRALLLDDRTHASSASSAVSLAELAAMPLILPARGRPLRDAVDAALAARSLSARVAVEASGWSASLLLARLGCGVALVNDVIVPPRGERSLTTRDVHGLAPVVYRAVRRRRAAPLALELFRCLRPS